MIRNSVFFFFLLISYTARAQFIMPYEDNRKYFYVFENGAPRQLETMPVLQYKYAGNTVLYINNANELRLYYNGEKTKAGEGLSAQLGSTGFLLYYRRDQVLTVFENGKENNLTYFLSDFKAGDNILAWKDSRYDVLKAWYKGQVQELEYTLVSKMGDYAVGDNVVAYINGSRYFKVFCEGEIYELSNWEPVNYYCGRNMVAWVDGGSNELKLFSTDKIVKLENFAPQSIQMGDDIVAYVSDESAFKIYTKGKLLKIESYAPDSYTLKDNILAFFINNRFQVFYNGERYELENVMPRSLKISNNTMAYMDNAGRLKLFIDGKTRQVTTDIIKDYELNGNILKFTDAGDTQRIYFNGKIW